MTDEVCIPQNSNPDVYHEVGDDGRPTCQTGQRGEGEFRTVHRSRLPARVRYCRFCAGTDKSAGGEGVKPSTKLANMDPEDLGLSPVEGQ